MNHNVIIDQLEYEMERERRAFAVPIHFRQMWAQKLQADGIKPRSTGVHGTTRGYGMLNHNGFWQYPLPDKK